MLGGEGFADLAVDRAQRHIHGHGPDQARPDADRPGAAAASPLVQLNLVATFDHRRADTGCGLNSRALAVVAEGMVDLGQNQFQDLRVAARLIAPGAIGPNINGSDVRLAMVLNGAFANARRRLRSDAPLA